MYLLVSGSFAGGELLYAAGVATGATILTVATMRIAGMNQHLRFAWGARLLRPLIEVVSQLWPLTMALVGALRQRRRVVASLDRRTFDPGESERAEDRGRRALVTLAISISPATLVLERDVDRRELTIARVGIAATAPAPDDRWPI